MYRGVRPLLHFSVIKESAPGLDQTVSWCYNVFGLEDVKHHDT